MNRRIFLGRSVAVTSALSASTAGMAAGRGPSGDPGGRLCRIGNERDYVYAIRDGYPDGSCFRYRLLQSVYLNAPDEEVIRRIVGTIYQFPLVPSPYNRDMLWKVEVQESLAGKYPLWHITKDFARFGPEVDLSWFRDAEPGELPEIHGRSPVSMS